MAPPATWLLLQLQPKVVPLAVTDSHLVQEEVGSTARAPGHRQGQQPPIQLWGQRHRPGQGPAWLGLGVSEVRPEMGEGAEVRPEVAEWGSQHRAMLTPCACGECPVGEGQGPGARLGQGGPVHPAEKYAGASEAEAGGREGRADTPDRGACSAARPALASGPRAAPACGTPAPGTTARTPSRHSRSPSSGCRCRGNGGGGPWLRRRKGRGHRPPSVGGPALRPPCPAQASTH